VNELARLKTAMTLASWVPDSVSYRVLFDVARDGFNVQHTVVVAGVCAGVVVLGALWPRQLSELVGGLVRREVTAAEARALAVGLGGFGMFLSLLFVRLDYARYEDLRRALQQHRYVTVEGVVSKYVRGDSVKNIPESFEVGGHRYSFRAGSITDGYKGTFSGRSDIRNGSVVRIADMDGVVARLEVSDSSSVRSP
jgi:hypothetical protein